VLPDCFLRWEVIAGFQFFNSARVTSVAVMAMLSTTSTTSPTKNALAKCRRFGRIQRGDVAIQGFEVSDLYESFDDSESSESGPISAGIFNWGMAAWIFYLNSTGDS